MTDDPTKPVLASRLREAREYLGLTRDEVAGALRCSPRLIDALEDGTAEPNPETLARMSGIYQRSVDWLRGESTWQPDPGLLRKVENLTDSDRNAILDFAEFLAGAGPAPQCVDGGTGG